MPDEFKLDQFWRCPTCGLEMAAGPPAALLPPRCSFGHTESEMEQINAEGFEADPGVRE